MADAAPDQPGNHGDVGNHGDTGVTINHALTEAMLGQKGTSEEDVFMTTEETMEAEDEVNTRFDDMARSILALETCTDVGRRKKHVGRYSHTLKGLRPIRFSKSPDNVIPVVNAGFFSLMTYNWMTSIMWNIYKKGIETVENLNIGTTESSKLNAERLDRLWTAELTKHGPEKASFVRAVMLSLRTKLILIIAMLIVMATISFAGPAFILHRLLAYLATGNVQVKYGIALVAGLVLSELLKSLIFGLSWYYSYNAAIRLKCSVQGLLFRKILKLRSLKDKSIGELVNLLSNDGQRIFEAAVLIPLMFPGPVVLLYGLLYTVYLVGPWAAVAIGTYIVFYPILWVISRVTNYYRRKGIRATDTRVRTMNELLTYIKLIKMYAWEKSFAKAVACIRSKERGILEKAAYVQSISTAISPLVPVMASVFTFCALVLTGYPLSPVEAFTVVAVLNSLRFTLGVLPFCVRAIADAKVSFERYRSILMMEEIEEHQWSIFDDKYALVVNNATFSWDMVTSTDVKVKSPNEMELTVNANKGTKKGEDEEDEEKQKLRGADGGAAMDPSEMLPAIRDLTFMIQKGKLIGICGGVGSGKSSLLSAILGRMVRVSGKIAVDGSIAYVTQQAWIMNTTVRENILFGQTYDKERYDAVVQACALISDFEDFVSGDMTEIGERGVNLSGGQKQRISLARAAYSNNDIYLLDDPLSAVDIHVGRHIFAECLAKLLSGKTVLFVTHQLQYLNQCDSIIVIKDGKITEAGTHDALMTADQEYASLIKMFYTKEKEKEESKENIGLTRQLSRQCSMEPAQLLRQRTLSQGSHSSGGDQSPRLHHRRKDLTKQMSVMQRGMSTEEEIENPASGKLMVAEEKSQGAAGWETYKMYFQSAGGFIVSAIVLLSFIVSLGAQSFANWWLSYWLNQGSGNTSVMVNNETIISQSVTDHPNLHFYILVYGLTVPLMLITTFLRALFFMKATLRASSNMHDSIFSKMLRSPMEFFDTTPVGRIINRFSGDMDEIDVRLPFAAELFIQNIIMILFSLGMIAYVSPWFLIAMVPLGICFVLLQKLFTSGVRELKRMESVTRSPFLSHVTASVQGISTIRAYQKSDEFVNMFDKMMDNNTTYYYLFICANRWLATRLDFISITLIGVTGVCVVLTYDNLTPATAGLALSFAIQVTGLFQFTIRQAIETEAKFVAVQRVNYYSKNVIEEAPAIVQNNRPPDDWPKHGEIKFQSYRMRYRQNLPLAIKGVALTIKAQEKIGIVGRSGSGKSSLGVGLFRLVEPADGTIIIDDIDITKIGVEDLRSRLSIIPQDPVLFSGTVRYNLDPFDRHTDDELWGALEKCHCKDTISNLEAKLESPVVENGENFSVGERQLMCMARALLRHSKILMLDEATAAIDTETDALVQTTIKEAFHDCTMLIIAHRLNTVLSCDRILVMEDGKAVEYGKPSDLIASKTKFKAMMEAVEEQQDMMA